MQIQVGSRKIGEGCKPFLIAEVGSNWKTLEDAKESVVKASQSGADAVKFQAYTYKDLYGIESDTEMPGTLPLAWLPILQNKASACGIEFMCSAFSPKLAGVVNPYVNIHKIASAELTHVKLLEKTASFGKPVILSTGASGEADIEMALRVLRSVPVILLYCVSDYPAREVKLGVIDLLRSRFNCLVGYSDHTTDVLIIPRLAVMRHHACVIEKHFSIRDFDTPDAPHSLTVDHFRSMFESLTMDGACTIGPTAAEMSMVLRHNRRLIAIRDILPNDTFTYGKNFGIYRSLKDDASAASPWLWREFEGKIAQRKFSPGDGISPRDID